MAIYFSATIKSLPNNGFTIEHRIQSFPFTHTHSPINSDIWQTRQQTSAVSVEEREKSQFTILQMRQLTFNYCYVIAHNLMNNSVSSLSLVMLSSFTYSLTKCTKKYVSAQQQQRQQLLLQHQHRHAHAYCSRAHSLH